MPHIPKVKVSPGPWVKLGAILSLKFKVHPEFSGKVVCRPTVTATSMPQAFSHLPTFSGLSSHFLIFTFSPSHLLLVPSFFIVFHHFPKYFVFFAPLFKGGFKMPVLPFHFLVILVGSVVDFSLFNGFEHRTACLAEVGTILELAILR